MREYQVQPMKVGAIARSTVVLVMASGPQGQ
jgi:hypothetical protein